MLNLAAVGIEGSFKRASSIFGSLCALECVCAVAGLFFVEFGLTFILFLNILGSTFIADVMWTFLPQK